MTKEELKEKIRQLENERSAFLQAKNRKRGAEIQALLQKELERNTRLLAEYRRQLEE